MWDDHLVVKGENGEPDLIYIDLHLVHEVTSPQAFDGLRAEGRPLRRLDLTIATEDHNTPTLDIDKPIADLTSRTQIETLRRNAEEFGVRLHSLGDKEQGIVHVVGPQLGLTMPGITVVCGDSHTSTHGAFGAMAFGIGTSEVEHVMATQTLPLKPFKTMAITVEGTLKPGRDREGHHPRRHREDRHRRRSGLRARIPRQRDPRPLDGGAHDDLQHVDRGRRPRGHGRPRRDDVRVREGQAARSAGSGLGGRRRLLAHPSHRRGRRLRRRGVPRRERARAVRDVGHQPRAGRVAQRRRARRPTTTPTRTTGPPPSARWSTWR